MLQEFGDGWEVEVSESLVAEVADEEWTSTIS